MQRDHMECDVLIIGGGPAGLATAIRLKQCNADLAIFVLEKGASIGAHSLSGAVLDPRSFDELLPHWQQSSAPLHTRTNASDFLYLRKKHAIRLPTPPLLQHEGSYIISLGELCCFLAEQAEALGVDIYPGFAGLELLYDEKGAVKGVVTGEMGREADGKPSDRYQPGLEISARQTVLAEGCHGSLTKIIKARFGLDRKNDPPIYGLGIKELWDIRPQHALAGKVIHTIGWPLDNQTYGGGFLYHLNANRVAIGFVAGLDYRNPYFSPFEEFQRFKTHPVISKTLEGGRRIGYGARCLSEGGIQSLPQLVFPGGLLVGDTAGFLNVPRIKGIHAAIKSGMLAAESINKALHQSLGQADDYPLNFRTSWLYDELWRARNIRPSFDWGLWLGLMYSAIDSYCFRGRAPWTLHHSSPVHKGLSEASQSAFIDYPKPDNILTFDRVSSVFLTHTEHRHDQPVHLVLKDDSVPITVNLALYDAPEQRYCPAKVYEIVLEAGKPRLQINAQNCIHCKACDIKDPTQNIVWKTPEGGSGPNYTSM